MKLNVSKVREYYSHTWTSNMKSFFKLEHFDFLALTMLYAASIFVNKYVLSVLKFTFPTVFQGWQTLVGMIILKILNTRRIVEVNSIDRSSAINLLPHCLFFVGSIVSGSKALAILPIPVFAAVSNLPLVCIFLLDYSASALTTNLVQVTAGVVSLLASISIVILDVRLPFADSGYSWLLAHVVFTTAQLLYSRLANPRFTETDKLYYSNIFSVIVLAPSSFYLEEAFSALNFQHRRQLRFYLGCLLSGVLGVSLQLWVARMQPNRHFANCNALAKITACVLSIPVFTSELALTIWSFVAINLFSTAFVPIELESVKSYQDTLDV